MTDTITTTTVVTGATSTPGHRNAFETITNVSCAMMDTLSHAESTAAKEASMYSEQQSNYIKYTNAILDADANAVDDADDSTGVTKANTKYQQDANLQSAGMSFYTGISSRAQGDVSMDSDAAANAAEEGFTILKVLGSVAGMLSSPY